MGGLTGLFGVARPWMAVHRCGRGNIGLPLSSILRALVPVLLSLVFLTSFGARADTAAGVNWLLDQTQTDGSIAGSQDLATPTQATAETLRAFQVLDVSDPAATAARDFLNAEAHHNTEYLARKIIAEVDAALDPGALVSELLGHQHTDGSFGDRPGYDATIFDTALAVEALALAGQTNSTQAGFAVGYLLNQQNADGGWGLSRHAPNDSSSVFVAALTLNALAPYRQVYNIETALSAATDLLLAERGASHDWGETFVSALVLISLVNTLDDLTPVAESLAALRAAQQANGSWADDVYTTALALRALKLAEAPPSNPGLSTIIGTVVDGRTNLPLAGVTVILTGPSPDSVVTDADGAFRFHDRVSGDYTLQAELTGYGSVSGNTVAQPGQTIDFGTLQLLPENNTTTATIRGVISDADTGQALSGATVALSGATSTSTVTDENGEYQFTNVAAGAVTIQATKTGYSTATGTANLTAGSLFIFSAGLSPVTTPQTALRGTVTDGDTGQPLANASIAVTGSTTANTTTDALGTYLIANLTPGDITIVASSADYDGVTATATVFENNILIFSPALYPDGTTPADSNTADVTGVVVDSGTNQPLTGVGISATFGATVHTLTTNGDGRFTLTGLTDTAGTLQFDHPGYVTTTFGVSLVPLTVLDIGQVRLRQEDVAQLLPDLIVGDIDAANVLSDSHTLTVSGHVSANVENQGTSAAVGSIDVLAFYDADQDGTYDAGVDLSLGQGATTTDLGVGDSELVTIDVQGDMPYRDAPVSIFVDRAQTVIELDETNNVARSTTACTVVPDLGTLDAALKWHWSSSSTASASRYVVMAPMVGQTTDDNGDGQIDTNDIPDVVFVSYADQLAAEADGILRIISGEDGSDILSITDPQYRLWGFSHLALGDIDGDGVIEIVGLKYQGGFIAFNHDGTVLWELGPVGATTVRSSGGVSLADLEGDGLVEIVLGNTVVNHDGTVRWVGSVSYVGSNNPFPAHNFAVAPVVDIDLDGNLDIVTGSAVYDKDGNVLWNAGLGDGFTGIGNFNEDEFPEIALVTNGNIYLLDHLGQSIWGPVTLPGGGEGGPPTIADMDGDGLPEIGVAGATRYAVFNHDGSLLWSAVTQDTSSRVTGSTVFDFDGDGAAEVVYGDEQYLRVYDGATGDERLLLLNNSRTGLEFPVVADIDNDGHAEMLVVGNMGSTLGVRAFEGVNDDWLPTRNIWNQHAYHINNVNDDGTIPAVQTPSWLTHNTFRLNTFVDRDPLSSADLTAGFLRVIEQGTGGLRLTATIGNGGAAPAPSEVTVAFYEGDPNTGGTLLGEVSIPQLSADSFQDVSLADVTNLTGGQPIFVVVDPQDAVTECREDNNTTSVPAPDLKPDLIVASMDKSNTTTDLRTLHISGILDVEVVNIGSAGASGFFLAAFVDENQNDEYDVGLDTLLGVAGTSLTAGSGEQIGVSVPIDGMLAFRDAPITVWVDSTQAVAEGKETNNYFSTDVLCRVDPLPAGSLSPVLKWNWSNERILTVPLVAPLIDTNGDTQINELDDPYVIVGSHLGFVDGSRATLRVLHGKTGQLLWSLDSPKTEGSAHPAVGDIDGDGIPEIVMYKRDGGVAAINNDGSVKWQTSAPGRAHSRYNYGSITLADIEGDGLVEILARNYILNSDGSVKTAIPVSLGHSRYALAADLDLDGQQEVLVGGLAFNVDGTPFWHNSNIATSGLVSVANFDDDDFPEIAYTHNGGQLSVIDHNGEILWTTAIPGGGAGAPTVADMDGDGLPEIGVAGRIRYAVFNHDGSILWSSTTRDLSSRITGSTVFDFDGDGRAEVIYGDEYYLRVYDGLTGTVVFSIPNRSATATEAPVVADIDNDGHAELLVVADLNNPPGIRVFENIDDLWMPTRHIWNQHAYHIDNINDDLSIPRHPTPSWLSHNTFRLNTFADRDARDSADLTASVLGLIDNGAGQPLSLKVRIGNAGLLQSPNGLDVAFYDGDPDAGGVLLGTLTLPALAPGDYLDTQLDGIAAISGTQSLFAVADAGQQLNECDETNNRVSIPFENAALLGDIEVATDAPVYGPNQAMDLSAEVTNLGNFDTSFVAELRIEDASGALVTRFAPHTTATLPGGTTESLNEPFNTGAILAGPYNLVGVLRNLDGAVVDEDTAPFVIQHTLAADPAASLRTTTDRPVYHTTDTAQLQNLVRNLTTNTVIESAALTVLVTDPAGETVFDQTLNLGQLTPGALREIALPFRFEGAPTGLYTVFGVLRDAITNEVLANDQTLYDVQHDLMFSLVGDDEAQWEEIHAGDAQICTDHITNISELYIEDLPVRRTFARIDEALEISSQTGPLSVASGATETLIRNLDTGGVDAGDYSCVLQAQIEDEWITLDYDVFRINEPPIRIDATLTPGDRGRVLILLDEAPQQCSGLTELGLESDFATPLAPDATVQVDLYGPGGSLLDSETAPLDNTAIDLNSGSSDANLVIDDLSAAHLAVHVAATGAGQLDSGYQVIATITQSTGNLALDSTAVPTDCATTLTVGNAFGDFRVTEITAQPAANDPLGPNHIPDLNLQRAYLEQLLTNAGWSYTIVTNDEDFTRELRTGGYVTYLLLSEHVKLDEPVQKELREAVYRGEGLIEAGSHDQRQGRIDEALGVKFLGKHANMLGVSLTDLTPHPPASVLFALTDKQLRAQLEGADAAGFFNDINGITAEPAVTTYAYGQGRSVYAGLDLLAEATLADDDQGTYASLLLHALEFVHPDLLTPLAGGVYPIRLTLVNEGIATPGQVVATLPPEVTVVDAGGGVVDSNTHTLTWGFDLAEAETLTFNAWLELPATQVHIDALVQTGIDPDWVDHVTVGLNIAPQVLASVDDALNAVLALNDKAYKHVEKYLEWAQQDIINGDYELALGALVRAADELIKIGTTESDTLRSLAAQAIRNVAQQL